MYAVESIKADMLVQVLKDTVRLQIFNRENIREKHYFLINRNFQNKIFVNWCHFRDNSD